MSPEDKTFLRDFFRAVTDRALEPDDPCYVPLYQGVDDDPVELLARGIEWTPGQSVQLLSGFKGTGKSTELRRLRRRLRQSGYLVVLCDMEDFINLSTPIDVSDFLMALMGAFSEALEADALLGSDPSRESWWERLGSFLTGTKVDLEELSISPGFEIKASLKSDPTFKQKLQQRVAGHLGELVKDVQRYSKDVVRQLQERHEDAEVVLLVDSMEHIRGTSANAAEVHRSVETMFAGHADKLHFPHLHVVYTVPPYLKIRYPNLGGLYSPGGLHILPAVKIRADESRDEHRAGFDVLERVVASRGDWEKLLGIRASLDALIRHSGGHLRDLLRLIAEVLRRAPRLPVPARTVEAAVHQLRNEFLPIANNDARWLQEVAETHTASLEGSEYLPDLARFLDTHMVLCYRNGREWYDVHPLIAEEIERQVRMLTERASSGAAKEDG